jgi:ribosomal protein S27AE
MMSRFKVIESDMLFDIEKDDLFIALKENRCPKCGCKLVFMRNGKMSYCKSVRHKKRFCISIEKLNKINGK